MGIFDWDYPPGCSRPSDDYFDPHKAAFELLEAAGVDQETIDKICIVIETLKAEAVRECSLCAARTFEATQKTEEAVDW